LARELLVKQPVMHEYKEPTEGEMFRDRLENARDPYDRKSRNVDQRVVSHDSSGVEQEMVNLKCYDDGDGNNIAEGDLSVQRMVENGMRDHNDSYPEPYDTRRRR